MSSPSNLKDILDRVQRYTELSEDEMYDLYDELDTLYNELISRYLEALARPQDNLELVRRIIDLVAMLLAKEKRSLEEELTLIALLDILATDLYNKTVGFVQASEAE